MLRGAERYREEGEAAEAIGSLLVLSKPIPVVPIGGAGADGSEVVGTEKETLLLRMLAETLLENEEGAFSFVRVWLRGSILEISSSLVTLKNCVYGVGRDGSSSSIGD